MTGHIPADPNLGFYQIWEVRGKNIDRAVKNSLHDFDGRLVSTNRVFNETVTLFRYGLRLLGKLTPLGLGEIGELMGGVTASAVSHAIRTVEDTPPKKGSVCFRFSNCRKQPEIEGLTDLERAETP